MTNAPPDLLLLHAAAFRLASGIHVDSRRFAPFFTECVVGHVCVHAALGERSPERLGRGLEEGIAEVLGGLFAAGAVVGDDAAEAAFAAFRLTSTLTPHREAFLAEVRRAALIHEGHGVRGLAELVRRGRDAVKAAEGCLARGELDGVALGRGSPEPALKGMLDRLLLARGRPLAVSPLAYLLSRGLKAPGHVRHAAD